MVIPLVLAISFLSLIFAGYLTWYVLKQEKGEKKLQDISEAIKEGANAFLKRQYTTVGILALILGIIIFGVYIYLDKFELGLKTSIAFLFGAFCSGLSGFVGMYVSIRANVRAANAATKSMDSALKICLRGGAVSGITIVALSLLGVTAMYLTLGYGLHPKEIPFLIVGYGFGASFVALFAQLGGGIYTKAADVGADLVGKIEAGIPEDDPRNPAVIADLVGDNVGDCAGRGADLFESTAAENIGAMIIGVALFPYFGINGILFPLVARAFGLIATIVGVMVVKTNEQENPMTALNRGYFVTSILAAIFFYLVVKFMLGNMWFFYAGLVGIITSLLIVYITIYYTSAKYRPVQSIAAASQTGHATNIITGFSVALECTALPAIVLSLALIFAYKFGEASGLPGGGLYGTAMATMGMLATCAYILAMDTFGPIADNAGGIIEMSGLSETIKERTDKLDACGNTTKALTKGYAIGSAALAAFLLFRAYMDEVVKYTGIEHFSVDISKIPVFVGGFIGAMLVFLFSALAIRAVGDTAYSIVNEVRRQFKENPGIMEWKVKPDYAKSVDICAKAALKKMIVPGFLVVVTTVIVGVTLHYEAVASYLMVATIAGVLLALLLNTGGGAWDNAKKLIESGVFGGKGSEAHKAAVTGDTVGDPFKDTAGPSLHVLIKMLGTITLVLLPLFL
jgi:K(+)-stimulated pyrophosphate-energized sodium pump